MLDMIVGIVSGLRRQAAQTRAIARELKRIGDILEMSQGRSGTGFKSLYSDPRPDAVNDAELFMQSDAELGRLQRRVKEMAREGRILPMDQDPDEIER